MIRQPVGQRGIDGQLGQEPQHALVVRPAGPGAGRMRAAGGIRQAAAGQLPGAAHQLADPAHAHGVRVHDGDRAQVVQVVLGLDGGPADAAPGHGQVRVDSGALPVDGQRHGHELAERVDAERDSRRRRGADDLRLADELQQPRVPAAAALNVIGVHGAGADSGQGVRQHARLVQRVRVQRDGNIGLAGHRKARVDNRRIGTEVLMHLEPGGPVLQRAFQQRRMAGAAAGEKGDVERHVPPRIYHPVEIALRVDADVPHAAEAHPDQRRHAGRERDVQQGRRGQVHVGIHRARGRDQPLAGNQGRVRVEHQLHVVDDVGIARPGPPRQ